MSYEYTAKVIRIVDADTIWLDVDLGFDVRRKDSFRLAGINAPEVSTVEGKAARDWLVDLLKPGDEVVVRTQKDHREKYGRYLAVIVSRGRNLNDDLVKTGHAVLYDGGKR